MTILDYCELLLYICLQNKNTMIMNISDRMKLKAALKKHGVFMSDVAAICECHRAHVYHILTGRTTKDSKGVLAASVRLLAQKIEESKKFKKVLEAA